MTAYVSIGNSDDKLTQQRWHQFYVAINVAIHRAAQAGDGVIHGQWVSEPASAWQNACWCIDVNRDSAELLKLKLAEIAADFDQDSVAWAEAATTEFLSTGTPKEPEP